MKRNRLKFYLGYTLSFLLVSGLIAFFYCSQGKSLINYGGDGFRQFYRAMIYNADYVREFFYNLFVGHRFVLPQWDFAIGEGSDILGTFHYYGMGDVFTCLSFLVPDEKMYLYYDLMIFVRIYCSGLAFSSLCFYMKKENWVAVLSGTMLYVFCSFSMLALSIHTFFIGSMVFLPMIIEGVEKIINGDKPYLLIVSVCLSSLSSIYFFYMMVILTVVYALIRLLFIKDELKNKLLTLIRIGLYAFVGVLLSGIIFLPMFYAMITNSRVSSHIETAKLYDIDYYRTLFTSLVFSYNQYYGSYTIMALLSMIVLFFRRRNRTLMALSLTCVLFMCLPFFGLMFNAFVYATDRWVYAIALVVAYVVVECFEDVVSLGKKDIPLLGISILYYALCILLDRNYWQLHIMFMGASFALYAVLLLFRNDGFKRLCCYGVVMFCILFSAVYRYSPIWWNYAQYGADKDKIYDAVFSEKELIADIGDDSYFRYSGDVETNAAIHGDSSSTIFYWSVANGDVMGFRKEVGLLDHNTHHYDSYDERYVLNSLAGVRYYVLENDGLVPYDYEYVRDVDGYRIYESKDALPLAFGYDAYMLEEDWKNLDILARQDVMASAGVIEEEIEGIGHYAMNGTNKEVPYSMKTEGLSVNGDMIDVKDGGARLIITPDFSGAGEYYLIIEGLDSDVTTNIRITVPCGDDKTLYFKNRFHIHNDGRHDFMANLGYLEEKGDVVVTFPDAGTYAYASIRVEHQPLEKEIEGISKLNDIGLKDLALGTNTVDYEVSLDGDRLICMSIPYSKGWRLYVDGEKRELIRVDQMYMGMALEKGSHEIHMEYETPFLRIGAIASLGGLAALIAIAMKDRLGRKHEEKQN